MAHSLDRIPDRQILVDGKPHLYFGGTAYLGLQSFPPFEALFLANLKKYGIHYGASRRSNVSINIYGQGEAFLADWVGSEACLTMSSGYLVAQLVTQFLLDKGHSLFSAPNAHTALHINGVTKTTSFEELNQALHKVLLENGPMPVVLFDTIDFSGQQYPHFEELKNLPLDKIMLVGDDSHGMGIVGENGQGCYTMLKELRPANLLVCCSLGKGLGVQSGAVFGSSKDIESLRNTSFYGGASPTLPAFMGTLIDAKSLYTERRNQLMKNYHLFLNTLEQPTFFDHMKGHPTFEFVDATLAKSLEEQGFIFTNFKYPDEHGPLVSRIVLSAYHKKEDVLQLANCVNTLLT
ncbi:MAG: pyridoxal phosphate-dependent aminotransferase family protein [Muricauda sp.]|nr:pyridoxal phosphate-dependent aminotransferase family protein [Allomuricauda sp.]